MYKILLSAFFLFNSLNSFATTIDDLEEKAYKGDETSQFRLGLAYEKGTKELAADYQMAEYWYELAYKKGSVKAGSRLAFLEIEGGDLFAAKKYLKKGLEEKFPYSVYLYGKIMIEEGNKKGYEFIAFAAKRGVPDALYDYAIYKAESDLFYQAYIYAKLATMKKNRAAYELASKYSRELSSSNLISANSKISKLYKEMEK